MCVCQPNIRTPWCPNCINTNKNRMLKTPEQLGCIKVNDQIKDGRLLLLLVTCDSTMSAFDSEEGGEFSRTIGFNNLKHDGEDVWHTAGWSWCQDYVCTGHGNIVYYQPMPELPMGK